MSLTPAPDATALAAAPSARVEAWIDRALARVARRARDGELSPTVLGSALSTPALLDAIETSTTVRREIGEAASVLAGHRPVGRVAMILPANVETAVVRPLVWALLARNAVGLRVSSRHAGLAPVLLETLREEDAPLARALVLVRSDREDRAVRASLAAWADRLHVWGRDETVAAVRADLDDARIVSHGSGLSLAFVTREGALRLDTGAFGQLALDVARYDQRGCLSPHAVLVEEGASVSAADVALRLHQALCALERAMPRGVLSPEEATHARAWRDTAHAIAAHVHETPDHAVSVEPGELRTCPGVRHVAVHVRSRGRVHELVSRLGGALKSLAVVDAEDVASVTRWLAPRAHVVPFGRMQTPSLLDPADHAPPWTGFVAEHPGAPERTNSS